jgi:hypothetical protein
MIEKAPVTGFWRAGGRERPLQMGSREPDGRLVAGARGTRRRVAAGLWELCNGRFCPALGSARRGGGIQQRVHIRDRRGACRP